MNRSFMTQADRLMIADLFPNEIILGLFTPVRLITLLNLCPIQVMMLPVEFLAVGCFAPTDPQPVYHLVT